MHQWYQQRHHTIKFLSFHNIYKVLTAPNGAEFTICRVILSTKRSDDLITPLFVGIDVSPEGDVVIICDIDLRIEAEALLALRHLRSLHFWERRLRCLHRGIQG